MAYLFVHMYIYLFSWVFIYVHTRSCQVFVTFMAHPLLEDICMLGLSGVFHVPQWKNTIEFAQQLTFYKYIYIYMCGCILIRIGRAMFKSFALGQGDPQPHLPAPKAIFLPTPQHTLAPTLHHHTPPPWTQPYLRRSLAQPSPPFQTTPMRRPIPAPQPVAPYPHHPNNC